MPENSSCSSASTCSRESCEGCPSKAKGGSGIAKEPMNKASNVKKVIGVVSGKGGVGKSFVTSSLACAMNKAGYKVGIMDADITGPSIPKMFGVHGQVYGTEDGMVPMAAENGIKIMSVNLLLDNEEDPVIWRGPVIAGVVKQFWNETVWGDIDYLFVDMPPGTGDVPLTVFQSLPVDGIVVVTSPQELVQMIVKKAYNMANMMHIPVLALWRTSVIWNVRTVVKRSMFSDRAMSMKQHKSLESRYLENYRSIRLTQRKRMKENSLRSTIHI